MTEYHRNLAVGVTAATALAGVAYLIMLFGDATIIARRGYTVKVSFPTAGGLESGSDVRLNGLRVGSVAEVHLRDDPRVGVMVSCHIDAGRKLPRSSNASLAHAGFGAGDYVRLSAPVSEEPLQWLATDGSAMIEGHIDRGGMLGAEMMGQVERVVDSFESFRRLADNLNAIAGDPTNRRNIREAIENLNSASAAATETLERFRRIGDDVRTTVVDADRTVVEAADTVRLARRRIDEVAGKLIDGAEGLGELIKTLNRAAGALTAKDGTAGRILNDPALYNNLRESAEILSKLLAELQATVETWQAEGVKLNL